MAASGTIGRLRVILGMDSAGFDRGAQNARQRIVQMRQQFQMAAAGLTAFVGGLSAIAVAASGTAREIQTLSQVSNTSAETLQAWGIGAQSVGLDMQGLSDILKDTNDRIGDFVTTGGGPMADFFENIAPQIGITADAFRDLSGADALQLFVSSLEEANVSQAQMTFYMEALAGESTRLLPLLRGNGAEMARLAANAQDLGAIMDDSAVASLSRLKAALGNVDLAFDGVRNRIAAEVAPALERLASGLANAMREGGFLRIVIDTLIDNLGLITRAATGFVVLMGARFVIAMARAAGATSLLSGAMIFLRGAIIRTGFGALIIGAVELFAWFNRLIQKTGGFGNALVLLGEVAAAVWEGIKTTATAIGPALNSVWASVKAGFLEMLGSIQLYWFKFLASINRSLAAAGLDGPAQLFFNAAENAGGSYDETIAAAGAARAEAGAASDEAAGVVASGFDAAREALSRLRAETDEAVDDVDAGTESIEGLNDALEDTGGGAAAGSGGAAGAAATAIDEVAEAADGLSDAAKTGAQSVADLFSSVITRAKGPMEALGELLGRMAEVQAQNAIMGWAQGGGGGGFFDLIGNLLTPIPGNANGTSSWRGGPTAIHERGGEIIDLPGGTRIWPADVSRRMADAGTGVLRVIIDEAPGFASRVQTEAAGVAVEVVRRNNDAMAQQQRRR